MYKIVAIVAFLMSYAVAGASQEHEHGKHHKDAQMAKLHRMMPRYAKTQALIQAALEKGDLKGVVKQTDYILSTTPDLKKSTPHKNSAQRAEFIGFASDFERDVEAVADAAKKGDLEGARGAFASAVKQCNSCHAKFRS